MNFKKKILKHAVVVTSITACFFNGIAQVPVTSGLKLHLDAASGYNSNGSSPSTWTDLSGSGNSMISGTGSKEPTYFSNVANTGFAGVYFDGSGDFMVNQAINSTMSDTTASLFVVRISSNVISGNGGGNYKGILSIAKDSTFVDEMGIGSDWGLHHSFSGNWVHRVHPCFDSVPTNRPVILSALLGKQPQDVTYQVFGSTSASAVYPVNNAIPYSVINRRILLGGRFHSNSKTGTVGDLYNGYILEVLVYNRKLTLSEAQQVNNYLFAKYYGSGSSSTMLTGDTICAGEQAYLTYYNPSGPASINLSYSDGVTNYSKTVQNGVPFALTPNPVTTTVYFIGNGQPSLNVCSRILPGGGPSAVVLVKPKPNAITGNDTAVCKNTQLQLNASGGGTYQWYSSAGNVLDSAHIQNPKATVNFNDTFHVIVDVNGCKDTADLIADALSLPVAQAGNDTAVCKNSQLQLSGNGGVTYHWHSLAGNIFDNPNIANPKVTIKDADTLSVIVVSSNGCKDTSGLFVDTLSLPVIKTSNDTIVCKNTQLQLNASGGGIYQWYASSGNTFDNPNIASPTTVVSSSDTLHVIVVNTAGCRDTANLIVKTFTALVANAGTDTAVCKNTQLQLNASGGGAYQWYSASGNTFDNPNIATPKIVISNNDTFYVVVANANDCKDTAELIVNALSLPTAYAGKDTVVCPETQVGMNGTGGDKYFWFATSGSIISNDTIASPYIIVKGTDIVHLVVTDTNGCTDTDIVVIKTTPPIQVNIGKDTEVCAGKPFILNGSGGPNYYWYSDGPVKINDPHIPDPLMTADSPVTVYLVISNAIGCTDTGMIKIRIIPISAFSVTPQSATICIGSSIDIAGKGGDSYVWWQENSVDSLYGSNVTVSPLTDTRYYVRITEAKCNISDTLSVNIHAIPIPNITASKTNDIDCSKGSTVLSAEGADTYEWSPADNLSSASAATTVARPKGETEYTVIGTNEHLCSDTEKIVVNAVGESAVKVIRPNAFTPDNNGLNDCYKVQILTDLLEFEFAIYNRWGSRVFYAKNPGDCWDGIFNGEKQPVGTYYYFYKAKSEVCSWFDKGDVLLLR